MKKDENAREAFLQEQGKAGKFRSLKASSGNNSNKSGTELTSFENITNYRNALATKMKKRSSHVLAVEPCSNKRQRAAGGEGTLLYN
jgi:hypothetical protein